jgi:hypothetical protein
MRSRFKKGQGLCSPIISLRNLPRNPPKHSKFHFWWNPGFEGIPFFVDTPLNLHFRSTWCGTYLYSHFQRQFYRTPSWWVASHRTYLPIIGGPRNFYQHPGHFRYQIYPTSLKFVIWIPNFRSGCFWKWNPKPLEKMTNCGWYLIPVEHSPGVSWTLQHCGSGGLVSCSLEQGFPKTWLCLQRFKGSFEFSDRSSGSLIFDDFWRNHLVCPT